MPPLKNMVKVNRNISGRRPTMSWGTGRRRRGSWQPGETITPTTV